MSNGDRLGCGPVFRGGGGTAAGWSPLAAGPGEMKVGVEKGGRKSRVKKSVSTMWYLDSLYVALVPRKIHQLLFRFAFNYFCT